jgi:prephenate dehydrogenase
MEPSNLGDAEGEDLNLHMELGAAERLDAILESRDLTHEQALESVNAMHAENQATFPHMIETSVIASSVMGGPEDTEVKSYIGPFVNRRAAEAWATQRFAKIDRVSWQAIKIITPEQDARQVEEMRQILEEYQRVARDEDGSASRLSQLYQRSAQMAIG